jgi:hypothetical protein
MSGSASKRPAPPRPSYEDGKLRDPEIEELQERRAKVGEDQRAALLDLLRRTAN